MGPGLIPAGTVLASATSDCSGTCVKTDSTITNAGEANPVGTASSHYSIDINADAGGTILINKVVITYTTSKVGASLGIAALATRGDRPSSRRIPGGRS